MVLVTANTPARSSELVAGIEGPNPTEARNFDYRNQADSVEQTVRLLPEEYSGSGNIRRELQPLTKLLPGSELPYLAFVYKSKHCI